MGIRELWDDAGGLEEEVDEEERGDARGGGEVVAVARLKAKLGAGASGATMRIRELRDGARGLEEEVDEEERGDAWGGGEVVAVARLKAKRALVGAGSRVLFYPTLLYNVLRNRCKAEFRW